MSFESDAYVALLYGCQSEFLLCALLLGENLHHYGGAAQRILLVEKNSYFAEEQHIYALECFWRVQLVKEIKCPNATRTKRHELAFTKLHAFSIEAKHVIYLDLDILVRSPKINVLFNIQAPAGMYHGCQEAMVFRHGHEIDPSAFSSDCGGCINTGVLRIDPAESQEERDQQQAEFEEKASQIAAEDATCLPEQYFLVQELLGPWRHISAHWNWEVGPEVEIKNGGVHLHATGDWANITLDEAVVVHFSGRCCLPWRYLDLDINEIPKELKSRYGWRDPRGRITQAVSEWCFAVKDLKTKVEMWSRNCSSSRQINQAKMQAAHAVLSKALERLEKDAPYYRCQLAWHCEVCEVYSREVFWWYGKWLCAECALHSYAGWQETPHELQQLEGHWVDRWTGRQVQLRGSLGSDKLQVEFHVWAGSLKLLNRSTVIVHWASDRLAIEGVLNGHVIKFKNNAEWLHIKT